VCTLTQFSICVFVGYIAPEGSILSMSYSFIRKILMYEDGRFIRNGEKERSAFYLLEMEVKFCNFPVF
jgi:hypothetical protein